MHLPASSPVPVPSAVLPARPGRRLRLLRDSLLVGAITLVLTLVLLEVGLRLFRPQYSPEFRSAALSGLYVPDATTGYRNRPGAQVSHEDAEFRVHYAINAQGLREDRASGPAAPGTTRLLALGDSFTFGWGVPAAQTFPRLLPTSAGLAGLETVNAGVNGYGSDNEAAWLQTYGWSLGPRIVLAGFFVGNDVRDVMLGLHKTAVDAGGNLVPTAALQVELGLPAGGTASGPLGPAKTWLAVHSQAYVFLRALAHGLADFVTPAPSEPATPGLLDTAPFYYAVAPPDIAAGWDQTLAILDQLRADCTTHGARFVVVAIPTREQVEDSYWQAMKTHFGLRDAQLTRDGPQQRLAAWSARTGTPLIDLLPGFRAAGPDPPRYFRQDPHWNPAGDALAAQLIGAGLSRLGLVARP